MAVLIITIILFLVLIYCYSIRNYSYWSKRNVKHEPPLPLFGNHFKNLLSRKSITEISVELYKKYPGEKVIGYYKGPTPELIVKDPEIIRKILTLDFTTFYQRGLGRNPGKETLFANLFHAEGDRWRLLRQRLTPAFTTAKLHAMFPLVVRCAERLQGLVQEMSARDAAVDARELMARFTTEFIGACVFGIEMDTINKGRSQFRELGKLIFTRQIRNRIMTLLWDVLPELRKFIKIDGDGLKKELTAIIQYIRAQRNFKPIGRSDFIDLLLELEAKGKIHGESIEKVNSDGTPVHVDMEMDLQCQVAQVFIFFAAGFETSSSATSFTLHLLAYNLEVQKRVQNELDTVLKKHDNKLSYEAIAEMTYLDMTFKESLRIFPSVGVLNRVCTRRYKIEEIGITIDPGVKIMIPVQAIHMDEQYHDNPKEFRPERFKPETVKERHHFTYLPFGEGPRICIGARLGLMQSLAGLAAILHKFSVEPAPNSHRKIKLNPLSNIVQAVMGGLPLLFKPRINSL